MKAEKAFSFAEFCQIASRHETDFDSFGTVVTQGLRSNEGSTYTFKDNGSDVLAVAHLDTVQRGYYASIFRCRGERVLLCPRLDDRLGVYIITKMLPRMGITCDILLTTGEEVGMSSAENFIAAKDYNWAFSFDRQGDDVVLYQHDYKRLRRVMRKAGFQVGLGSFSDISSLDIGCSGINFGCGYYDPHGEHAYAKLSETFRMVDKFAEFHAKHAGNKLPFNPESRFDTMSGWSRRRTWYSSSNSRERYYAPYSHGYPDGVIWTKDGTLVDKDGQYLDWYDPKDVDILTENGQTPDERLETLADQALREDNGR